MRVTHPSASSRGASLPGFELVQRIACRSLHRLPRAPCPRGTGMRRQRVLKTALEENRAPALAVVAPELELVLLTRHTSHGVADVAPVIEALVQKP